MVVAIAPGELPKLENSDESYTHVPVRLSVRAMGTTATDGVGGPMG
jgi:hypothetical protein